MQKPIDSGKCEEDELSSSSQTQPVAATQKALEKAPLDQKPSDKKPTANQAFGHAINKRSASKAEGSPDAVKLHKKEPHN